MGAVRQAIERLCLRADAAAREKGASNSNGGKGGAKAAEATSGGDHVSVALPTTALVRQPLPAAPEPAGQVLCAAPWRMLKISERPLVIVIDEFICAADCSALIALAAPLLGPAKVGRGLGVIAESRTCQLAWITGVAATHPAVARLERRVLQATELACALQGRRPLVLGESTQVLRYNEGEQHGVHIDPFSEQNGERAATLHVYLNDVEGGGATSFPFAEPLPPHRMLTGCRVPPKRGRAVLFWSRLHDGSADQASRHEGEAVLRGTKSCATCWLNEPAPEEGEE